MTDKILSKKQVAEHISFSTRTLERMVDEGRFPAPFRLGQGSVRIGWKQSQVQEWLDGLEQVVD